MISAGQEVKVTPFPNPDYENGCMYNRGNDYVEDIKDPNNKVPDNQKHRLSSYSVAGLTTYSLRTAAYLDLSVPVQYPKYMISLYEPSVPEKDFVCTAQGDPPITNMSVPINANPDRVSFRSICASGKDRSHTLVSKKFTWGSLADSSGLKIDVAATNWFTDFFLMTNEHEPEQQAILKALVGLNMGAWNNSLVHYLGAFGDSKDGQDNHIMALAFRDGHVKSYIDIVRANLQALTDDNKSGKTEPIFVLLRAFAPTNSLSDQDQEKNRAFLFKALSIIGNATEQQEFASVIMAGFDFNLAFDSYNKVMEYKKTVPEKPGRFPNTKENQANINAALASLQKMEAVLNNVKQDALTADQRQFIIVMREAAKGMRDEFLQFGPPVKGKGVVVTQPPVTPGNPPAQTPPTPKPPATTKPPVKITVPDPFSLADNKKDHSLV